MSVIHQPRENPIDARVLVFPTVLTLGLLVVFMRLWFLQVASATELSEKAATSSGSTIARLAPRGPIVDRNGVVLAATKPKIVVTGQPKILRKDGKAMARACALLGMSEDEVKDKLAGAWRPYAPTPLKIDTPIAAATKIAESGESLPGLAVDSLPLRSYTDTKALAHILGYVWTPSQKDLERFNALGLKPADYVGKIGLEYTHETQLMGKPGIDEMQVDARHRPVRFVSRDAPVPGDKLILGLDADLQQFAMEKLAGRRGGIVALDPRTGEVLCSVSAPTYDSSLFLGGIKTADYKMLMDDPQKPMVNRAIASGYAPGSTFKIVTSLAAMLAGKFDPNRYIYCQHYFKVGNKKFACLGYHGSIRYEDAFAKSCNAYFAQLGVDAGVDNLRKACAILGLGSKTGIDLLGESKGIVPTEAWIKKWRKDGKWYLGDTVNFSVGQGEISATPLQMASVASFVANRGVSYKPHLVRASQPFGASAATQVKSEILAKVDAPEVFWNSLIGGMAKVVTMGTARSALRDGVTIAGKTGSAENRKNAETHSWFVCFAPVDHPQIAIAIVVENAGHGGEVAAPIAGDIIHHYLVDRPKALAARKAAASNSAASARAPSASTDLPNSE